MGILEGRVAIVTGSGMGIGRAIALDMARQGAAVVTNNRMPREGGSDAAGTAAGIHSAGGRAAAFFGDVADFAAAQELVATAIRHFGRVDILVNNAGGEDQRGLPWEMAPEDWERTIRSHLTAAFNCIRHASGHMKEQGWGRILNTTSRAWVETTEQPNYAAAMAGLVGLTRDVARDAGRHGITCNAYSPLARTRRTNIAKQEAAFKAGVISRAMWDMYARIQPPEACAPFATFLCSEDAAHINGQVFGMKPGEIFIYPSAVELNTIHADGAAWSHAELADKVNRVLLRDYVNPAPRKT